MADEVTAVRISGLSHADMLDLRERVGADAITLEPERVPDGHLGDPATIAVVIIATAAALKGFVAYLAFKDRARQGRDETITHTIEMVHRDGTTVIETISYHAAAAEGMSASALRELSTVPGLDSVLAAETGG